MNSKSDVLIVGGGAIGLCAAYYLSRAGASVTVVDMGEMGHGCSRHNAGYVSPSHFVPLASPGLFGQALRWMANPRSPLYIRPRLDPDLIAWGWRFWRSCTTATSRRAMPLLRDLLIESSRLFEELSRESGMNFDLEHRGLCMLFATDRGRRTCEHESSLASEMGVECRLLDRSGLHELDTSIEFRAAGGIFFPGDSHLLPSSLVRDLEVYLEGHGVRLVRNCTVTGFEVSGERVQSLSTSVGSFHANDIVLAGGAWSPSLLRMLGIKILMQPGKGYSITVRNPVVKPTRAYIFTERRVAVTPFAESLRFAGTMEISGMDLGLNRRRIEAILDAIPMYFGNVRRPSMEESDLWAGLRPVTPDGLPFLGRTRQLRNVIIATGHAMIGISLAPVTGKLVAEIVSGRPASIDLSLLDPARFS